MEQEKKSKAEKRALRLQQDKNEVKQQRHDAAAQQRNKKIINIAIVTAFVIIVGIIIYNNVAPEKDDPRLDRFAACLTEQGAVMYGTDSCSHCQEQKRLFGKAFKDVLYINCESNPAGCDVAGVTAFPTWIFADGEHSMGVHSINELSEKTGCEFK